MKFGKTYSEYIEKYGRNRLSGCSYVEFKRLKKLLKKCPLHDTHTAGGVTDTPCTLLSSDVHTCGKSQEDVCLDSVPTQCDSSCPGCDAKFFGELTDELAQVVGCFNNRAQQLLQLHLASGLWKYVIRVKSSLARDPMSMIQEGQTLVNYASVNAIAVRKILKKYDKVHISASL
jgi:E3 ubiquitin-protein ligase BAH